MCSDIKKFYNIFTGKEVDNFFEALGYEYYADESKKVYAKLNMENDIENQVRQSFAYGWTYFKSAYFIDGNGCNFKWLNNSFYIRIK